MITSFDQQEENVFVATHQTVLLAVENNVATLTLNRPERYNSFIDEMHEDFRAALRHLNQLEGVRCLVITGAGKAFCTGQDLNSRYALVTSGTPNLGESLNKNYNPLIEQLNRLPMPVVCALNGVAAGAGVGLVMASDIVIAADSASLIFAFAKVGLIPDAGCTWGLVNAVGLARARALCLLGDTVSAAEAHQYGLVYKVVPAAELMDATQLIVQKLLANPAQGQALTKRALLQATHSAISDQLATEAQLQTLAGRTQDYAEAVKAFVEKRPPVFSGN